jgi:hypothetical protein
MSRRKKPKLWKIMDSSPRKSCAGSWEKFEQSQVPRIAGDNEVQAGRSIL